MPELPEVEVLVRHLGPLLVNKMVRGVQIHRAKITRPTTARRMREKLVGTKFKSITRRAKYLLFKMKPPGRALAFMMIGHLGMTGRMYVQPAKQELPKHVATVLEIGRNNFVFEDTRYFGRLSLDDKRLSTLGPEPLEDKFNCQALRQALRRSSQPIKVKLLDQSVVAGIGNIYASESLFSAGISPCKAANRLINRQCQALAVAIRETLTEAIECGSTVPLDFAGTNRRDRLFYYGRASDAPDYYEERLKVYDRKGEPCLKCTTSICRIVQAGRATYFCPRCQRG
jgi:formamidopyrimidine-DNA glycosylase